MCSLEFVGNRLNLYLEINTVNHLDHVNSVLSSHFLLKRNIWGDTNGNKVSRTLNDKNNT